MVGESAPSCKVFAEDDGAGILTPHRFVKIRVAEQFSSRSHQTKQKTPPSLVVFFVGDPWENRTPVSALRGPCLSRLTNGPSRDCYDIILQNSKKVNTFLKSFSDFFALYQNCIFFATIYFFLLLLIAKTDNRSHR